MPGILRGRIAAARSLPIMDSSAQSTDAYCELRFGRAFDVNKTLNPQWNYDFKYEIDDDDIQDETFQVTVMDRDTIGNDSMIGPLVKPHGPSQING